MGEKMNYESDIVKRHYENLNRYRDSFEYQASPCKYHEMTPVFKLAETKWRINKEIFWHFLEILPPMGWRRGENEESFHICEYTFDNWTTKFIRKGNRYYCQWAEYPQAMKEKECWA
jgi:hypothetical protein